MSTPGPLDPQGPELSSRPLMSQWWRDLAFVHWRVDPARVAPLLPDGARPDVFDGSAWVGLIPFRMVDAGVGNGPPVPWLGTFLETNVRVYSVDADGRRGVVFLSLDCSRLAATAGARAVFGTPYHWARMRLHREGPGGDETGSVLDYRTSRRGRRRGAGGRVRLRVGRPVPEPDDLAVFLTARFGLHTRAAGRTWWVPNTHAPWPLHEAVVEDLADTLVDVAGLPGITARPPDSVLWSPGVHTWFGLPRRI